MQEVLVHMMLMIWRSERGERQISSSSAVHCCALMWKSRMLLECLGDNALNPYLCWVGLEIGRTGNSSWKKWYWSFALTGNEERADRRNGLCKDPETRERLMLSGTEKKFSNPGIESGEKRVSGDPANLCKPV